MENDRRDDPQPGSAPSEHSHREEPVRRDWDRGAGEARESSEGPDREYREPSRNEPETGEGHSRPINPSEREGGGGAYEPVGDQPTGPQTGGEVRDPQHQGGPGGGMGGGRGRNRRGGRGRMAPRDRRMGRNRGPVRDRGDQFHRPSGGGRPEEHRGDEPRREEQRYSDLPPEQRSLIQQAKAEVEHIREALEAVLRDLEHVSEQLIKAEHEKDVAEAEIEQLRDQLRRLHR